MFSASVFYKHQERLIATSTSWSSSFLWQVIGPKIASVILFWAWQSLRLLNVTQMGVKMTVCQLRINYLAKKRLDSTPTRKRLKTSSYFRDWRLVSDTRPSGMSAWELRKRAALNANNITLGQRWLNVTVVNKTADECLRIKRAFSDWRRKYIKVETPIRYEKVWTLLAPRHNIIFLAPKS